MLGVTRQVLLSVRIRRLHQHPSDRAIPRSLYYLLGMWCRGKILPHLQTLLRFPYKFAWATLSHSYSSKSGKKGKVAPLQERKMVDRFKVLAKGGDGGNGCWSTRRSRTDWHGKPDGGNGGRGGDVILECSAAVWDFSNLQHHLNAKRGGHGVSKKMAGSCGSDRVVLVPVGTVIHLVNGETPQFLGHTSKTDLQPWEIPDTDEVEHSKSEQHISDVFDGRKEARSGKWGDEQLNKLSLQFKENDTKAVAVNHVTHSYSNSSDVTEKREPFSQSEWGKSDLENAVSHSEAEQSNVENAISHSEVENIDVENAEDGEYLSEMELEEEVVQFSVAELTESGQRLVIASGGQGGLGNAYIGKGSKYQKKFKCKEKADNTEIIHDDALTSLTAGSPGSETVLILELKSIADVGLVGMPNVGKSTLLGAISRAKPQVGHYAFTTLRPNIGKLNYKDFFSVTVADIPGIIKGAHENRGLGHAFLRHIERTKLLVYVVDLAAALDDRKGIAPWEQLRDLVMELEFYQEGLSDRPSLIVANKIDEDGAEDVYKELKRRVQGVSIFPVCAILEDGIPELKDGLRSLIDDGEFHMLKLGNIAVD